MNGFLENSALLFEEMAKLDKIIGQTKEYIGLKQTSVMTDEQEEIVDRRIEELDGEFDKLCHDIKEAIEGLKKEKERESKLNTLESVEMKMREAHIKKLYTDLRKAIFNYRVLKSEFKNKEKDLLKQAYLIVNPQATEESLEKIMSEQDADTALVSAFSLGGTSAKKMLQTAQNRRKKIDRIIEIVNRLVALIEEIDNLVNMSAKVVDEIVIHMTQSEKHTEQATKELEQSLAYQRKINFIKKVLLGIFLTVLFVVVVYFVITMGSGTQTVYFNGGGSGNP